MKNKKCLKQKGWPPAHSKNTQIPKLLLKKEWGADGIFHPLKSDAEFGVLATVNITWRTSWGRRPPLYPSVDCRERVKEDQRGEEAKIAKLSQTQRPFSEEDKNRRAESIGKKAGYCDPKGLTVADKRGQNGNANGVAEGGGPVTARIKEAKGVQGDEERSVERARNADETDAPRERDASGHHGTPQKTWAARRGKCWQTKSWTRKRPKKENDENRRERTLSKKKLGREGRKRGNLLIVCELSKKFADKNNWHAGKQK